MPLWALKFLPYAAGGAVLLALFLYVRHLQHDSAQLHVVQQEYAVYRTQVETGAKVRKEVSDEYEGELSGLRAARDAAPVRAVRLCPSSPVPSTTGAPGVDHGPAPSAGSVPEEAGPGPDIGQPLFRIADDADEVSARLRACQAFVRKLATPGEQK